MRIPSLVGYLKEKQNYKNAKLLYNFGIPWYDTL